MAIDISTLTAEDKGRWVEYQSSTGDKERGRIKSWNTKVVFVVYKCDGVWDNFRNYTAAATNPKELNFVEAKNGKDKT